MGLDATTKQCTRCGRDLPHTDFHKDTSRRDGLTSACKTCRGLGIRRWYERNRNTVLAHKRLWHATHREQQRAAAYRRRRMAQARLLEQAGVEQLRLDPDTRS